MTSAGTGQENLASDRMPDTQNLAMLLSPCEARVERHNAAESVTLPAEHELLVNRIFSTLAGLRTTLTSYTENGGPNAPVPELGPLVDEVRKSLATDPIIQKATRSDRAMNALYLQVANQLKHVCFAFEMRDNTYVHAYVLEGRYPCEPTQIALRKVCDFLHVVNAQNKEALSAPPSDEVIRQKERDIYAKQTELVRRITGDSLSAYREMRQRLVEQGPNAPFPELQPVIEHLHLKLHSDSIVRNSAEGSARINAFRSLILRDLDEAAAKNYGYITSLEAIQRCVEFLDVVHRAHDPERSPKLYHSDRYDYYGHFLKGTLPDHIIIPTIANLGATDILKARGVPISFVGVNTDITWVDGFWQTPYEFWVHDINHSRRMYQFLSEKAAALAMQVEEFAALSDHFVKTKLIPLIAIRTTDSNELRNKKRLMKVVLFEILHEDALAAHPDVVKAGILRPPNLITPFERIEGAKVLYVMEPGATTLAYVFRKLAHDFYDMPGARIDNIVAPNYRTRAHIAEVAETIASHLGLRVRPDVLEYLVSTDQGFPADFKQTVANDIKTRPGETIALDQEAALSKPDARALAAEMFHAVWQSTSSYTERWKLSQAVFKDGTGINDSVSISNQRDLELYFADRGIAPELHKHFKFQTDPKTGQLALYEDIVHLPQQYLAPNNQYENIKGASLAVDLIEKLGETGRHFDSVDEAIAWIYSANEEMNSAWLTRNASWAKNDPEYNRAWRDLAAAKQKNGLNLLKVALQAVEQIDSGMFSGSQRTLIAEALRRVSLEVRHKAEKEVRAAMTGDRIHERWQESSGYAERWKPFKAKLDCGVVVSDESLVERYLLERNIPLVMRPHFALRAVIGNEAAVLHENIQALPNRYLSQEHQKENRAAANKALEIIDRIWDRQITFDNQAQAARWLRAAAQTVHAAVLERNANGARENPVYNKPWRDLPVVNKQHDLSHVTLAFETRLKLNPGTLDQAQRALILDAVAQVEGEIA